MRFGTGRIGMATPARKHADPGPVTDRVHENSWSADLEQPRHADDRELVVEQAATAIRRTASGYHVNLVTHGDLGHPADYLFDHIAAIDDDRPLEWEYVDECGCGGHVTRVHVG